MVPDLLSPNAFPCYTGAMKRNTIQHAVLRSTFHGSAQRHAWARTGGALLWIVLLVAVACVVFVAVPYVWPIVEFVLPIDVTEYAPRFSEEAFAKVHVGQSIDEMKALIGEPIRKGPLGHETWYVDCGTITFDEAGVVIDVSPSRVASGAAIHNGMTKADVARICGEPEKPYYGWGEYVKLWTYTEPRGYGIWDDVTWKKRHVFVNTRTGKVTKIINCHIIRGNPQPRTP